jgi:SAM-dependent methyltransferase
MNSRACPVCLSHHPELLFKQQFTAMSSGSLLDSYDVVVCKDCGFGYADGIPTQDTFDHYYQDMSKYEYQHNTGQESTYDLHRFQSIVNFLTPFLPSKQARILDIGCATGKLLSLLKQEGYQAILGLDPSPVCAQTARSLYDISVTTDRLWDISRPDLPFNCVILSGVLEHICDVSKALNKITSLLVIDSLILIEVPDATRFADLPDAPFQEFSTEHIDFFSQTSLDNLLELHGYDLIKSEQNDRPQSDSTIMPVITAVYRYSGNRDRPIKVDSITKSGLLAYIDRSEQVEFQLQNTIDNVVATQDPIVVWGVGTHTQRLLATSKLSQANISAFVDSNPRYQGKSLQEIEIISPTELKYRNESIMISSRVFQSDIIQQIREQLNINNQLILLY